MTADSRPAIPDNSNPSNSSNSSLAFAKSQLIHHAKQHAAEWRRAGDVERAEAFLAIEGVIARVE